MDIFQKLTIVTCVTSSITLLIVGTALLPHVKSGMVVIRDASLWAAFVLLICFAIWSGIRGRTNQRANAWSEGVPPAVEDRQTVPVGWPWANDPYYRSPQ